MNTSRLCLISLRSRPPLAAPPVDLCLSGERSDSFLGSFSLSAHFSVQTSESSVNAGGQVSIYRAFEPYPARY